MSIWAWIGESCHAFRRDTWIFMCTYICVHSVCVRKRGCIEIPRTQMEESCHARTSTKHPLLPLALTKCYTHILLCICIFPPAPVNHVKIFKGWPLWDAPSKLVHKWYKTFLLTSVVRWKWKTQLDSGEQKSPELDFKYLYWRISKIFFWYLFTCMGTYMIDWVGRE